MRSGFQNGLNKALSGSVRRVIGCLMSLILSVLTASLLLSQVGCKPGSGNDPTPPESDPFGTAEDASREADPQTAYDGENLTVSFLNAGKADVIVIRHGEHVIMIDAGLADEAQVMTGFLADQGILTIDRLFLTHFDRDHIGGVPELLDHVKIGEVYVPWFEPKSTDEISDCKAALAKAGITPEKVRGVKEILTEDHLLFQIDAPQKSSYLRDSSNNSSLVIRLSYAEHSFLFCADAEEERIEELLGRPGMKAEVIKMPHHGGYEKNLGDLLDEVKPRIAVVTCSDQERESKKTEELLSDRGIKTFLTRKGTVTITVEEDRMKDTQKSSK